MKAFSAVGTDDRLRNPLPGATTEAGTIAGGEVQSAAERTTFALLCVTLFGASAEGVIVLIPGLSLLNRLSGLAMVGAFGVALFEGRRLRRIRRLGIHLAVTLAWILMTMTWAVTVGGTRELSLILQLPLLAVICVQMLDSAARRNLAILIYSLGGFCSAISVIIAWINKDGYAFTTRYTIGTVDPNYSGVLLVSSGYLFWLITREYSILQPVRIPATVAFAFAVILTGSRGAMVTGVLCFAYAFVDAVFRVRVVAILAGFVIVFASISVLRTEIIPPESQERINSALDTKARTAVERRASWEAGLDRFYVRPLQGSGFNTYSSFTLKGVGLAIAAHNDYARFLAELGLIGVVLILGGLYRVWKASSHLTARIALLTVSFGGLTVDLALKKAYWVAVAFAVAYGAADIQRSRTVRSRSHGDTNVNLNPIEG
jgi:O-antigen ligase